jgi:hypothetical protein
MYINSSTLGLLHLCVTSLLSAHKKLVLDGRAITMNNFTILIIQQKKEVYETGSQIGLLMIKATGPKFHNTVPLTYPLTLLTCEHQHIFIFSFYFVQHTITYVLEAFHLSLSYDSFPIF